MNNMKSFDSFINEAKSPKKEYMISKKVQDSIKNLCETMLHEEAAACDANEDKSQTYEGYINECGNYMKECMSESMEVYRSGGKFTNR